MEDQIQSPADATEPTEKNAGLSQPKTTWLKRVGWIGFFFFLLKGIAWLLGIALLTKGC